MSRLAIRAPSRLVSPGGGEPRAGEEQREAEGREGREGGPPTPAAAPLSIMIGMSY